MLITHIIEGPHRVNLWLDFSLSIEVCDSFQGRTYQLWVINEVAKVITTYSTILAYDTQRVKVFCAEVSLQQTPIAPVFTSHRVGSAYMNTLHLLCHKVVGHDISSIQSLFSLSSLLHVCLHHPKKRKKWVKLNDELHFATKNKELLVIDANIHHWPVTYITEEKLALKIRQIQFFHFLSLAILPFHSSPSFLPLLSPICSYSPFQSAPPLPSSFVV